VYLSGFYKNGWYTSIFFKGIMKKILLIIVFTFITSTSFSQIRDFRQAESIAYEYIFNQKSKNQKNLSLVKYDLNSKSFKQFQTVNSKEPYYIFSDTVSMSLLIVSGDERMKKILGVSEFADFRDGSLPEGLKYLLETYRQQFELLQSDSIFISNSNVFFKIPDVAPLLQTRWRQEYPFNALCPSNCPSGCVATAMSQVMKYHSYPVTGKGSFSYTSNTRKYRCSYNFSEALFEWEKMKNTYPVSSMGFSSSSDEISQITYACGVSVGMDYETSGSGAYMSDVPYALIHFFGYNDNVSYCDRTCYEADEWYQMLCSELEEGRPVIYGGVDSKNGGHAFVVDGCNSSTRRFHINWGWGGSFDGEYELDALDPSVYRFSSYQSMILYVSPKPTGIHRDVFYANSFSASSSISVGKKVIFMLSDVYCYSNQSSYVVPKAKFYGKIGIGLFDENLKFVASIVSEDIDGLKTFEGYSKLKFTANIEKSLFPNDGTYYIAPYVQGESSISPTRIRTTGGKTDFIVVTVNGEDVNGEDDELIPTESVSAWSEDFEHSSIPVEWHQEIELGASEWKTRYVLMPSDNMPNAAKGKGYAFLNYNAGTSNLYNTRTVTRLVTDEIPLAEGKTYNLSFQYRKYATQPEPTDVLTVYYKQNNDLIPIADIPVVNQDDWQKTTIRLPIDGAIRLAFEGSPSKGSSIFIDDINIFEDNSENVVISSKYKDNCRIYSLSGVLMAETTTDVIFKLDLPVGVYVITKQDGSRQLLLLK